MTWATWLITALLVHASASRAAEPIGTPPASTPGASAFFMSFHIDGFKGESYSLRIEGQTVRYRSGPYFLELNEPWRDAQIPNERLQWFKRYVKEIGMFDWKERYVCPVADGVGWNLELRNDGRKLISHGGNASPPRFNEFQLTIAWLLQSRFGVALEEKDCVDFQW